MEGEIKEDHKQENPPVEMDSMGTDLNDVIKKLEESSIEPDRETTHKSEDANSVTSSSADSGSASVNSGTASLSRSSSTTSSQKELLTQNGVAKIVAKANSDGKSTAKTPSLGAQKSKVKNPFSIFKRKSPKNSENNDKHGQLDKMLSAVKIDTLPQLFVTKYLGFKPTRGLYGIKYTREPLRELLAEINSNENCDSPLTQLHVSIRGIHVTEHKHNAVKSGAIEAGLIPIEFISYGVQDINYTRIFTFIIVREMSSRSRKLECHAYICDSSTTCRKLALSVALAFQQYAATLEGKPHKFQVDLRPMAEIDHDLAKADEVKEENIGVDCDA